MSVRNNNKDIAFLSACASIIVILMAVLANGLFWILVTENVDMFTKILTSVGVVPLLFTLGFVLNDTVDGISEIPSEKKQSARRAANGTVGGKFRSRA